MKSQATFFIAFLLLFALTGSLAAQSNPAVQANPQDGKGFTSYTEFGGSSNSDGRVFELDSSVGYNFSKHFGLDMGLPIYFTQASSSTIEDARIEAALGKSEEATNKLQFALSETANRELVELQFEARLALGEIETKSGQTTIGRAHLQAVERDAKAKGFLLIARKAAAARKG